MTNRANKVQSVVAGCRVGVQKVTQLARRTRSKIRRRRAEVAMGTIAMAIGAAVVFTTDKVRDDPDFIPPLIETKPVKTEGQNAIEMTYADGTTLYTRGSIRYGVTYPSVCSDLVRSAY